MATPDVVVIGGGYAGVKVARDLDGAARVTLVDRKEAFFHRISALRASADGEWTHSPFVPYDRLLKNGKVVLGKAVGIEPAERLVALATGEQLRYDVLVIATGADYQEPARFVGTTVEEAAKAFHIFQRRVGGAHSFLVVGGGPSGVELSAELVLARPNATVTLAHRGSSLLPSTRNPRVGRRARAWLENHGVSVLLNTYVSASSGSGSGNGIYRDGNGRPMGADLVYWATGTTPNTLWLRLAGHGDWLTESGHVRVDEHLRVRGYPEIFAIGDVNDVHEAKLAPSAMAQAGATIANVRACLEHGARHAALQPYKRARVRIFSVPLGKEDGVTGVPMLGRHTVLGSRTTTKLKAGTLMVPWARDLLGYPAESGKALAHPV
jgi:apoptosis-inducing factor 2